MLTASLFTDIGGVKTLVMATLAVIIAVYLWSLSRREKKAAEEKTILTADKLAATADEQLVDTVVRDLLASCENAKRDPYRMAATWSNAQVNVYSVWLIVKELSVGDFASLKTSPSGAFLALAADGFAQIGAPRCEAVVREALESDEAFDEAFAAAVAEEAPLTLCVPYIRDNAESFTNE